MSKSTRKYPRLNGKDFDPIRKKEFDKWRELFRKTLIDAASRHKPVVQIATERGDKLVLNPEWLDVAEWNLAFHASTFKTA